jgi:ribose transport system substrate-binding protein
MTTEQIGRAAPKQHIGTIVVVGLIALALAVAYTAWLKGAFKKHEKIAILTWNEDTFWDPTALGAADAARELGVDLTFIKSKPDEAAQTQHIHELLEGGIQGLALSPNNPKTQEAVINEAAAKAVVITFDSDAPNTHRREFVGTDDYAAGHRGVVQLQRDSRVEGG